MQLVRERRDLRVDRPHHAMYVVAENAIGTGLTVSRQDEPSVILVDVGYGSCWRSLKVLSAVRSNGCEASLIVLKRKTWVFDSKDK